MPQLTTQQDLRRAQAFDFCYRSPPLLLPTHRACNGGENLADEKIGQLIALRYGRVPEDPKNRRLEFALGDGHAAVVNCDVDAAVWRWIRGFHAALYGGPLPVPLKGALVTPFPRAPLEMGPVAVEQLRPQHAMFVDIIKQNRALRNLDRIVSNGSKLTYECVWWRNTQDGPWLCVFALDIYDWKDLGAAQGFPARGCAGFYHLPSGEHPADAALVKFLTAARSNRDFLDPFGH
jgi:hypothetical protein